MSGQWPVTEKPTEGTSCFPRVFQEAYHIAFLSKMIDQLLPDEVKIVSTYVESLIKTRPIRLKEDRAHMAVSELENDPK